MNELIRDLDSGCELDAPGIKTAVEFLLDEKIEAGQKAHFLEVLARKGETAAEIALFVDELLERAVNPEVDLSALPGPSIDVCGTGGDKLNLFNVSTTFGRGVKEIISIFAPDF